MAKKPYRSKSVMVNALIGSLAMHPKIADLMARHAQDLIVGISCMNILLRFFTNSGIQINPIKRGKFLSVLLALVLVQSCALQPTFAMSKKQIIPDTIPDAMLMGDQTALVDCGYMPQPGFCIIRKQEGDAANSSVWFIGPPSNCNRDSCVFVKLYNDQGLLAWGGAIPKGKTKIEAPWPEILGCKQGEACKFKSHQTGFWAFTHEVFYNVGEDERVSQSQGEIILRVFASGYVPLERVHNDSNFAWTFWDRDRGFLYKMTTGLRARVERLK